MGNAEAKLCSCMDCVDARIDEMGAAGDPPHMLFPGPTIPGWRYGCASCGNKRCPHHSNHKLACTGSNASAQPGSRFA